MQQFARLGWGLQRVARSDGLASAFVGTAAFVGDSSICWDSNSSRLELAFDGGFVVVAVTVAPFGDGGADDFVLLCMCPDWCHSGVLFDQQ